MSFVDLATVTIGCMGTINVFRQSFGAADDKYCAVYSVKWLRKRAGKQNFFDTADLGDASGGVAELDKQSAEQYPLLTKPAPGSQVARVASTKATVVGRVGEKVVYKYNEAGPKVASRGKAHGYREGWLAGRNEQTEAEATLQNAERAIEGGFRQGGAQKLRKQHDLTIANYVDFLDLPGQRPVHQFLCDHITQAGSQIAAYFYLTWFEHATACSYEETTFYWFDPACGEFSIPKQHVAKWFSDDKVAAYTKKLYSHVGVGVSGFRR